MGGQDDRHIAAACPRKDPDVSIIVCTRDRSADLEAMLNGLAQADIPSGWRIELVIVDNGSTDTTREVVEAAQLPTLDIIYLLEERRGKANALNTGVAAAGGSAVLFTDDDVRVPHGWIDGMCRPILEGSADAVQGGIFIAPHLERTWLRGVLRVWLAAVDDPAEKPEGLVGANMACSRKALQLGGQFDLRLGPGAAGFFDDTMLGWAIERAGGTILYRPEVAVEHHFDDERLTVSGFMTIARRMAHSRALVERMLNPQLKPPSLLELLKELPGFFARSLTQAIRYVRRDQPDAGFLARYYRIRLWRELHAQ